MRLLFCLILSAIFCSAHAQRMTRQQYVAKYHGWAVAEMNRTGIPASITLAQGILESDCGNSDLAVEANNHFGIKCHSDWTGKTMHKDDDKSNECFRSYENAYDSFRDHSDFLTSKSRYSSLFNLEATDYKSWAHGLKKCGYATERTYAERLIAIIEDENLSVYDTGDYTDSSEDSEAVDSGTDNSSSNSSNSSNGSKGNSRRTTPKVKSVFSIDPLPVHEVKYNNGVQYVEVTSSDSFENVASEFHMQVWEIYKYNDLSRGADISKLTYLYLRPKKNRAHPDCKSHEVKKGETIWDISQAYGIKLSKLEKRNGLLHGSEPEEGTILRLR